MSFGMKPVFMGMLLLTVGGTAPVLKADSTAPAESAEPNSPPEMSPALVEPGLSGRAVPSPDVAPDGADLDLESFYWQTHPFENLALLLPAPNPFIPADPSSFRPVDTYAPPLGLQPKVFRHGLWEFYPWAGLAQTFDSNVQLTPHGQISDFYTTPCFGLEVQWGTPDSVYNEGYDTVAAAHLSYEGYADLFYEHPDLSAYNQRLDFSSRVGRDLFLLRPFMSYSDITGSDLQLVQLENRVERRITTGGVSADYGFTPVTSWNQTYSAFDFRHDDPAYINYDMWSTRQELAWLMPNDSLKAIVWAGAQHTDPDAGSSGNEYLAGAGWQGEFSSRVHSELWLGWGALQLDGNVPGRENLSGLRYGGYTAYNWSERLRITLLYDRDYVFNESEKNDNYVATLTQIKAEVFLGNNWLVVPYLGCALNDFETSRALQLELRPELEFSYVFTREDYQIIDLQDRSAGSRIFLKFGYDYTAMLRGAGDPIQEVRVSTGFNWNF